ncbi:unnamed protein product [Ectocarpus sp. 8 AP-2014]
MDMDMLSNALSALLTIFSCPCWSNTYVLLCIKI